MIRSPLVRHGSDDWLIDGYHTSINVHTEMMLQICRDYSGLPDVRTLRASEIRFFFEGLRPEIKEQTRPR